MALPFHNIHFTDARALLKARVPTAYLPTSKTKFQGLGALGKPHPLIKTTPLKVMGTC